MPEEKNLAQSRQGAKRRIRTAVRTRLRESAGLRPRSRHGQFDFLGGFGALREIFRILPASLDQHRVET